MVLSVRRSIRNHEPGWGPVWVSPLATRLPAGARQNGNLKGRGEKGEGGEIDGVPASI